MNAAEELARFNALTPDDAKAIQAKYEGQPTAMRSCWYCNGAHEHLRDADYPFYCLWGCGQWYIGGYPAVVVARRAADRLLTDDDMTQFQAALTAAQED